MRVGIISDPMLFQRDGRVQEQVRSLVAALLAIGDAGGAGLRIEAADPNRTRLDAYDVIHVFSALNGNHGVLEAAREMDVPLVLSPLLLPGWNRAISGRAPVMQRLGERRSAWNAQAAYAHTKRALQLARLVIALDEAERATIMSAFLIETNRIRVFPQRGGAAPLSPQHAAAQVIACYSGLVHGAPGAVRLRLWRKPAERRDITGSNVTI